MQYHQQYLSAPDALWDNIFVRGMAALLAIALVVFLAGFVAKFASKVSTTASKSKAIGDLSSMLIKVIAWAIALFVALKIMQWDAAALSILAGAGVIGIVVGFALQDIAANFIAGIILAIQRPFRVGHLIETNDMYGVVKKIHLRSTELETLDGQLVHIPNKSILLETVTDYNYIPYRRVELTVGVAYATDLEEAKRIALEAITQIDESIDDKPIDLYYSEFADSSINFEVRFWSQFKNEVDYLSARSQAIVAIQKAFKENGIEIPFPIRTIIQQK